MFITFKKGLFMNGYATSQKTRNNIIKAAGEMAAAPPPAWTPP